jgi:hypothetical protein
VVEVADEADELAQALDVEGVEVDLVAAAGGPGRLGCEPACKIDPLMVHVDCQIVQLQCPDLTHLPPRET